MIVFTREDYEVNLKPFADKVNKTHCFTEAHELAYTLFSLDYFITKVIVDDYSEDSWLIEVISPRMLDDYAINLIRQRKPKTVMYVIKVRTKSSLLFGRTIQTIRLKHEVNHGI